MVEDMQLNNPHRIVSQSAERYPMPIPFGWYGIAYADEIAAGELKPCHYFDRELVLFRTQSGSAHLLDAFCRHMGAHLGYGGKIKGENLACPFHGWRWNGAGQCVEIPYAKRIPPLLQQRGALRSYPLLERNGVLYAWYHPDDIEPLWDVPICPEVMDDEWSDFKKFEWEVGSHIQEQAENSVDSAHFHFVHGTVNVPRYETTYNKRKRRAIMRSKMKTPRGDVDGTITVESEGPGYSVTRFTGICETVLFVLATPIDTEHTRLCFSFMQKKVDGKEPHGGVHDAIVKDICKQVEEDIPIWENKKFYTQPLLCDGDGPIMEFRRYYRQFYVDYTSAEKEWQAEQKTA